MTQIGGRLSCIHIDSGRLRETSVDLQDAESDDVYPTMTGAESTFLDMFVESCKTTSLHNRFKSRIVNQSSTSLAGILTLIS